MKNQLTGKEPGSGENLGQEEKGMTEDKTVRWHHQFIGHELGQTPGDGEGQGSLVCCSPWGHEESDHDLATEQQPAYFLNSAIFQPTPNQLTLWSYLALS